MMASPIQLVERIRIFLGGKLADCFCHTCSWDVLPDVNMGPLLFFPEASSFFLPGNFGEGGDDLSAVLFFLRAQKKKQEKRPIHASSSLQKTDSGVKKFGFKNKHTPAKSSSGARNRVGAMGWTKRRCS